MKRFLTILLTSCALQVSAQEVIDFTPEKAVTDSVAMSPDFFRFGSYNDWALHRGMNASLSASAIIGLGRHAGSGFSNSLSLMYADNIMPKLSFALGGHYYFLNYSGYQLKDAGLTAMLTYRFDEHWEATAFIQKSILQPKLPPQLYWINDVGDKIGASLRYNFNPAFSVSVSVWDERHPSLYAPFFPKTSIP